MTKRDTSSIRLSKTERKAIEEAADLMGRNVAEFIRIAATDRAFEVLKDNSLSLDQQAARR